MEVVMQRIVQASRNAWIVIGAFIAQGLSFGALNVVEAQFVMEMRHPTFDFQNGLTLSTLQGQLAGYTDAARQIYTLFAAVDFVFPLVSALFYCLMIALFLRLNPTRLAQRLLDVGLPLLPLVVTAADWLENIAFLIVVNSTGDASSAAGLGLLFKQLKLITLTVSSSIVALTGLWLGATWLVGLHKSSPWPHIPRSSSSG